MKTVIHQFLGLGGCGWRIVCINTQYPDDIFSLLRSIKHTSCLISHGFFCCSNEHVPFNSSE